MCILHAVEKVVFIGDYGVNKDPYNHLKHPELKVKKTMAEVPVQRLAPMDKVADWLDTAGLGGDNPRLMSLSSLPECWAQIFTLLLSKVILKRKMTRSNVHIRC